METQRLYVEKLNVSTKKKQTPYSLLTEEQKQNLRDRSRLYRQKNSEEYKQKQRALYYKNKEKRLEYQLQYDRTKRTEFLKTQKA